MAGNSIKIPHVKTALESLLQHGFNGFPIRFELQGEGIHSRKSVKTPEWAKYRDTPLTSQGINQLYENGYNSGLAVIMGEPGGNGLICYDIDAKNHNDPAGFCDEVIKLLEDNLDPFVFALAYIEKTPGGGLHIVYQIEGGANSEKLAANEKGGTIIETIGNGKIMYTHPTPGYEILQGKSDPAGDRFTFIPFDEHRKIVELLQTFDKRPHAPGKNNDETESGAANLPQDRFSLTGQPGIRESEQKPWERYNSGGYAQTLGLLERAGWKKTMETGDKVFVLRPAQGSESKQKYSAVIFKDSGILYVFSTSTIFESEKGFTPFGVKTQLEHKGDIHASVKAVCQEYGMNPGFAHQIDRAQHIGIAVSIEDKELLDIQLDKELEGLTVRDLNALPEHTWIISQNEPGEQNRIIPFASRKEFTLLTAAKKAGKSTFLAFLIAGALHREKRLLNFEFTPRRGNDHIRVALIDTEQSGASVKKTINRVSQWANRDFNSDLQKHFVILMLRDIETPRRVKLIERFLETNGKTFDLIFIDGIVDVFPSFNDPDLSAAAASWLLRWCNILDTHFIVVLHNAKSTGQGRGHLGTELENKAQNVINIKKTENGAEIEHIAARENYFKKFEYTLTSSGDVTLLNNGRPDSNKGFQVSSPKQYEARVHKELIKEIFNGHKSGLSRGELKAGIRMCFENRGANVNPNRENEFIKQWLQTGLIYHSGKPDKNGNPRTPYKPAIEVYDNT